MVAKLGNIHVVLFEQVGEMMKLGAYGNLYKGPGKPPGVMERVFNPST